MSKLPKNFVKIQERYKDVMQKYQEAGEAARQAGPVDEKTAHLIQLAAATAQRAEGAVHSHTKRALEAGATAEEVRHAMLILMPTIGFPTVAAALSWVDDILDQGFVKH